VNNLEIKPKENGRYEILLDDQDISDAVQGVRLELFANEKPYVVLDMTYYPTWCKSPADVQIDGLTAAVLRKLGWTPPKEET
jgi:hypothetical protein